MYNVSIWMEISIENLKDILEIKHTETEMKSTFKGLIVLHTGEERIHKLEDMQHNL